MKIGKLEVTWTGDPHLGRRFRTGVPLHRIGDREKMQWEQFEREITGAKSDVHVCMGDIFDSFVVPPEVVLRVAEIYRRANTDTVHVLIRGNHDVSRNTDRASSFDLLRELIGDHVLVVDREPVVHENLGFVPYDPFEAQPVPEGVDAVFGHWDVVDFGSHNVIPVGDVPLMITGHDHTPRELERNGVRIIVTGSMQPYSHGEDPEHKLYITLPLDEIGQHDLTNMNVRLLLREGEAIPEDLDCLSVTAIRVGDDQEEVEALEDFEALNLDQLLKQALEDNPVADKVMEFFMENRHA